MKVTKDSWHYLFKLRDPRKLRSKVFFFTLVAATLRRASEIQSVRSETDHMNGETPIARDQTSVDPCFRFTDFPNATRNITLLPAASGEKNSVTSSSKNVSPDAPRCWA